MLKTLYKIVLLSCLLSGISSIQAQGIKEQQGSEKGSESTELRAVTKEMPTQSSIKDVSPVSAQLVNSSQSTLQPVGVCPVISGVLAEYCQSNPGDISCSFQ